jgi:hypothetical protein
MSELGFCSSIQFKFELLCKVIKQAFAKLALENAKQIFTNIGIIIFRQRLLQVSSNKTKLVAAKFAS